MFPDNGSTNRLQRGFLMPVAAFILAVMGLLALTLSRNTAQTSIAASQEAIAVQTFYAAESGAQWGANQLFYNTGAALTRLAVDGDCNAMTGDIDFTVPGLKGCNVQVTCACVFRDNTACTAVAGADYDGSGRYRSFYNITSAATCGGGQVDAARTIVISAFLED